jgi:hypothetical protein
MAEVTLNSDAIAQLNDAQEYLKLRDANGRIVGYFLPVDRAKSEVIFGVKSPLSQDEIERRFREDAKTARPLADFWQEMRQKYPEQFQ